MDLARQTQLANILGSEAGSASAVSIGGASAHKRNEDFDPRFEEEVIYNYSCYSLSQFVWKAGSPLGVTYFAA